MPNFWDFPRKVRDKIYRMHLVHDKPIDEAEHNRMCEPRGSFGTFDTMPPLLRVSSEVDDEAAAIYFGENCFIFNGLRTYRFFNLISWHHRILVKRVNCDWDPIETGAGDALTFLAAKNGLQELTLRVDEQVMVRSGLRKRDIRQVYDRVATYSGQEQLAIYRFPGMSGLLTLRVPKLNFIKRMDSDGSETGGLIAGGVLTTQILPKITATAAKTTRKKSQTSSKKLNTKNKKEKTATFDFFGLPPELRNSIYDMLLQIDGPIHPSKQPPSTMVKKRKKSGDAEPPRSALCLLAVNKQIQNESVGIFYATPLVFYFPSQFVAFMLDMGVLRRSSIRDVTIHHDNVSRGGIESADLVVPLIRELKTLRRMCIVMHGTLAHKIRSSRYSSGWEMWSANPVHVPGVKALFTLRGITDISIRDTELEDMYEDAKEDKEYPDFTPRSRSHRVVKLTAALEHLNAALTLAQIRGEVNQEMFTDSMWHEKDQFPALPGHDQHADDEDDNINKHDQQSIEDPAGTSDQAAASRISSANGTGPRRSARISALSARVSTADQTDSEYEYEDEEDEDDEDD